VAAALWSHCDGLLIAPGSLDATGWIKGALIAPDVLPVKASITGIHAALSAASSDIVALAWDMPFVPATLIAELTGRIARTGSAIVPVIGGRPEPLCAAYAKPAAAHIAEAVRAGMLRNSEVLSRLPDIVWLEEAELRRFGDPAVMFFNVNTPADLERAEEIARTM
jgi:molybdopterin-guanine dinucleotide biosynthesis protein A